jgi:hypothetical protein
VTTAARRAEKRGASRAKYAAESAREAQASEAEDERINNAVADSDWTDEFTPGQREALARMFRKMLP